MTTGNNNGQEMGLWMDMITETKEAQKILTLLSQNAKPTAAMTANRTVLAKQGKPTTKTTKSVEQQTEASRQQLTANAKDPRDP